MRPEYTLTWVFFTIKVVLVSPKNDQNMESNRIYISVAKMNNPFGFFTFGSDFFHNFFHRNTSGMYFKHKFGNI